GGIFLGPLVRFRRTPGPSRGGLLRKHVACGALRASHRAVDFPPSAAPSPGGRAGGETQRRDEGSCLDLMPVVGYFQAAANSRQCGADCDSRKARKTATSFSYSVASIVPRINWNRWNNR